MILPNFWVSKHHKSGKALSKEENLKDYFYLKQVLLNSIGTCHQVFKKRPEIFFTALIH
jgi:hypothetical protein